MNPSLVKNDGKERARKFIGIEGELGVLNTPRQDMFTRLRETWFGQFYRKYLKKIGPVRKVVLWVWRNGYPIYCNYVAPYLFNWEGMKWRQLGSLRDFVKRAGVTTYTLIAESIVEIPVPKVYPVADQDYLTGGEDKYTFPEIIVAKIENCRIFGGTNLVLVENDVICHDLYDFTRDFTSEELHGRTLIDPKGGRIRMLLQGDLMEPISVGATFVDACAHNYAHWMSEVLPRIYLFCADDRFKHVPIIVNEGLHKNILESLRMAVGSQREIINLPIGKTMPVTELYLTSAVGYVPFERRTEKLTGHSHGKFSPQAFEALRNQLTSSANAKMDNYSPEKIFLRRNSGVRKLSQAGQVEKLMIEMGYDIIEPEKLTFLQQIELFSGAKRIVSTTGAGLVTAICCKPGTQVVVLMSKHKNMIYRYWSSMLGPLGIKVSYVLGNIVENQDLGIHGDFEVDINCIKNLLESLGTK